MTRDTDCQVTPPLGSEKVTTSEVSPSESENVTPPEEGSKKETQSEKALPSKSKKESSEKETEEEAEKAYFWEIVWKSIVEGWKKFAKVFTGLWAFLGVVWVGNNINFASSLYALGTALIYPLFQRIKKFCEDIYKKCFKPPVEKAGEISFI
ncbi:hypothetical protein CCACVL1_26400 [Corchorus capsularis]|uniref:Uncharacterized protein n=1 Tax=Corchorus capsularis TaxID=210143 RepID=A0A1R3GF27_COCAP|nr:hypothetical protein CCACVL1_26400 [Corchorus capsularis]